MLYNLLNILFKLSQRFYFKTVLVRGIDKITKNEANLLIANHPSAFKDPILIASNLSVPIHFLAAEEFMGGKKMASFLGRNFNMIPIYRSSTRHDQLHKNDDSFDRCYQALNEKKNILIFAEGHSETQAWLDPLKTGAARIALEALIKNPDLDKVNIIPIGLNYSNPHKIRSTFLLNVGKKIEINRLHKQNKKSLTQITEKKLNIAMNGLQKEESNWQGIILKVLKSQSHSKNLEIQFIEEGEFIKKINALKLHSERDFKLIKITTLNFIEQLNQSIISTDDFLYFHFSLSINLFYQFLLLLVSLPGFILHLVPYYFIKYFVRKRKFKYSFEGSMYFSLGTLVFIIWNSILTLIGYFFISWLTLLLPLVFITLGYFTLKGRDYLLPIWRGNRIIKNIKNNPNLNKSFYDLINLIKSVK
jgi:glycerol-3-phosphate O-acyltransferase/dihydroxyacetone phosphate acyltransferase